MRTRIVSTVGLVILALVVMTAPAQAFTDTASSRYRTAIAYGSDYGYFSGYADGSFRPYSPVLRAQFAKIIDVALRIPVAESTPYRFKDMGADLPASLYPHEYVGAAAAKRIILGYADNTFRPYKNVTRAQVFTMMVRAAQQLKPGLLSEPPAGFKSSIGNFDVGHASYLNWAEYNGLLVDVQGYGRGWDPWASMNRGEIAQVFYNLLRKSTVPTVTLAPAVDTSRVGTQHTVTASLSGGSAADYRFSYQVTGAHPKAATTPTLNATTFSYQGTQAGSDTITVRIYAAGSSTTVLGTATATEQWEPATPVVPTVALAPAADTSTVGTQHTVTASLSGGSAVDYRFSYQVTGAHPKAATTPTLNDTTFSYQGTQAGSDTITVRIYAAGSSTTVLGTATATMSWTTTSLPVQILATEYSLDRGATWSTVDPVEVPATTSVWFRLQYANTAGTPLANQSVLSYHARRQHLSPTGTAVIAADGPTTDANGWVYWTGDATDLSDVPAGQQRNVFMFLDLNNNNVMDSGEARSPTSDFTFDFTLQPAEILATEYSLDGGLTWSTGTPASVPANTSIRFRLQYGDGDGAPLANQSVLMFHARRHYIGDDGRSVVVPADSTTTDASGRVYWTNPYHDLSQIPSGQSSAVFMFLDLNNNNLLDAGELRVPTDFTFNFTDPDPVQILAVEYSLDAGANWSFTDPANVPSGTSVWFRMQYGTMDGKPLVSGTVHLWHARRQVIDGSTQVTQADSVVTDADGWVYWTAAASDLSDVPAGQSRTVFMFLDLNNNNSYDQGEPRAPAANLTLNFVAPPQ